MMRRLLPCLCFVLFCCSVSVAQDRKYPYADFTVGYTLNRLETSVGRRNLNGVTVAPAINFRKWFAMEGDLTFTSKKVNGTTRSSFTYLMGPRLTKRSDGSKLEPFLHALFGGGHLHGIAGTNDGWAGKFGGGLDIVAGKHAAIRVVQIDYYRYRSDLLRLNNVTFTFGVKIF
jgi:hypothetical protein